MKLNLLPTYVGKERAARSAILLSVILAAVGIGAAVLMITTSRDEVRRSEERIAAAQPQAAEAVRVSKSADTVLESARIVILNSSLAAAMNKHNSVYPNLYDTVRRYIPSFFRVTSMSAAPAGTNTVVTLSGVIQTQQQYADLMLALLRIPGASSVTRTGYQVVDRYIPALSEGSQAGAPVAQGATPLPDDPLQRLEYYMTQPRTEGFQDVGGFGRQDITQPKGAMPDWSQITVTVTMPGDIQTPNPSATLASIGSAPAPGAPPAGATPAGIPGGRPTGPPPGVGAPPSGDEGVER